MIEMFFADLDREWESSGSERIRLPIIGSTALFLQCDYSRGTKDSDVLQIGNLTDKIIAQLEKISGHQSVLSRRHRIYLDVVKNGIPFLPHPPHFHVLDELNARLKHFRLEVLDIIDVVVSKLKPFRVQDIDDIRFLTNQNLIDHNKLVERFSSAVDWWTMDARAVELPKYVENLNTVERDLLNVEESVIELPHWLVE